MEVVGLDFETYASTDLLKHGLHRYINCPDFRPLLAAVVFPAGDGLIFDFVEDMERETEDLRKELEGKTIVAHNAGFEQAVLARMGIDIPSSRFIDSAVLARAAGAAGKLEAAGPQLLGIDKVEVGYELIKLFSIPSEYQINNKSMAFDPKIRVDYMDQWAQFANYCAVDAELSIKLYQHLVFSVPSSELVNNAVTMDMNNTGWHVDMDLVRNMQFRYQTNLARTEREFRQLADAPDLNLASFQQLQEWCSKRGVRAKSFDEKSVARILKSIDKRLADPTLDHSVRGNLIEVRALLLTKQALGGSSLKKLQTIIDTVGTDGRLHDQYLHIGADATWRTTGRGVQMQNLKRLNGEGDEVELLFDEAVEWNNDQLASNLRQVFTATDPNGLLIVGDFSSVESRGLAWQAGEFWKTDAYRQGDDLYKVQAGRIFGIPVHEVTKAQRQIGKVGELACGYGAGPDAVKDFAEKMGVTLSDGESAQLVRDWREANQEIVQYWGQLDHALHAVLSGNAAALVNIPHGFVRIDSRPAPESLRTQVKDENLKSLRVSLFIGENEHVLSRVIHGAHEAGRNIQYWKPSQRKTGDLWVDEWMNPKTKRLQKFTLYGGKLAGLLTQSLCREIFFDSLRAVHNWAQHVDNVHLVGQFHDEIVLDWEPMPGGVSMQWVKISLEQCMTTTKLPGFPLAADIKHDYRYTK